MSWGYCYKEKFLVIKIQLVIHPLPHAIFATKKEIWQKTVLRQKHVLNVTLRDIAKFCKNDHNLQTCCGQTFEKTNIIHRR